MKKSVINLVIVFCILLLYFVFTNFFALYIPCLFHFITGLYCPGCGLTRMILSLFSLDFYQAFRYNMLLFMLLPFFIFFILNYIYALYKKKEPLFKKIPNFIWYIVIVILLLWGVVRNIFPLLAPTTV